MVNVGSIKMLNGKELPLLGLGTWLVYFFIYKLLYHKIFRLLMKLNSKLL